MKKNPYLTLGLLSATALLPQTLYSQKRPNIIMFLVDDMGWQDTSVPFYGDSVTALNQRYHTPNMERLAHMGVRFTHAYACAVSSPTRCSLMSGMNAARHRVTNWTLKYNVRNDGTSSTFQIPDWNCNGIQPDTVTTDYNCAHATPVTALPKLLHENGYYTIHCGKAHFGAVGTPGANPRSFGFDVNIAGGANGATASYLGIEDFGTGDYHVYGLEQYEGRDIFLTEALTIEAKKALDLPVDSGLPFFLYMSHYAVHSPYNVDSRFFNNYYGVYDKALSDKLNKNESCYAGLVEGMDKSLGDLLDYIEEKGIANNTIVLFMGDNGGRAYSPRQGAMNTQNYPAVAGKGSAYEGGVREPMMVYMPGVTKGGTKNENPIMIEDFFSTILDMAGVENPQTLQTVDGVSFLPVLKHPSLKRQRTLYWHYPNLWNELQDRDYGYAPTSSILKDGYKMIYFWETGERRLYDVYHDVAEKNNLAAQEPELLQELSSDLSNYLGSLNAQRPAVSATGELLPYPDEIEWVRPDSTLVPQEGDVYQLVRRSLTTGCVTETESNRLVGTLAFTKISPEMYNQLWVLEKSKNEGWFFLRNVASRRYMKSQDTAAEPWITSVAPIDSFQISLVESAGNNVFFRVSRNSNFSAETSGLNMQGDNLVYGRTCQIGNKWSHWTLNKMTSLNRDSLDLYWQSLSLPAKEVKDSLFVAMNRLESLLQKAFSYSWQTLSLQTSKAANPYYLSTNAQEKTEGSLSNLLDGNLSTFFHSTWSAAVSAFPYLQVDLGNGNSLSDFSFNYTTRISYKNKPKVIGISGSNDGINFTPIETLTSTMDNPLPVNLITQQSYSSGMIHSGEPIRFLRFTVYDTNTHGTYASSPDYPFFNLSEFGVTGYHIDRVNTPYECKASMAGWAINVLADARKLYKKSTAGTRALMRSLELVKGSIYALTLRNYPFLLTVDEKAPVTYSIMTDRMKSPCLMLASNAKVETNSEGDNEVDNALQTWYFTENSYTGKLQIIPYSEPHKLVGSNDFTAGEDKLIAIDRLLTLGYVTTWDIDSITHDGTTSYLLHPDGYPLTLGDPGDDGGVAGFSDSLPATGTLLSFDRNHPAHSVAYMQLLALINSIRNDMARLQPGDWPGMYTYEKMELFADGALKNAQSLFQHPDTLPEVYVSAYKELSAAYAIFTANVNMPLDGVPYYIRSASTLDRFYATYYGVDEYNYIKREFSSIGNDENVWVFTKTATQGKYRIKSLKRNLFYSQPLLPLMPADSTEVDSVSVVCIGEGQFKIVSANGWALGASTATFPRGVQGYKSALVNSEAALTLEPAQDFYSTARMNAKGFATLYLNYAVAVPEGLKAMGCRVTDSRLHYIALDSVIPPLCGALLAGKPDSLYLLPYRTHTTLAIEGNRLQGTLSSNYIGKKSGIRHYISSILGAKAGFASADYTLDSLGQSGSSCFLLAANTACLEADWEQSPLSFYPFVKPEGKNWLTEERMWTMLTYYYARHGTWSLSYLFLRGDTLLDGISYKKIYASSKNDAPRDSTYMGGGIGYDKGNILFFVDSSSPNRVLQSNKEGEQEEKFVCFDENLKVGDYSSPLGWISEVKDSLFLRNDITRRLWRVDGETVWIEGIGSPFDGILPPLPQTKDSVRMLLCCTRELDDTLYYNPFMIKRFDDPLTRVQTFTQGAYSISFGKGSCVLHLPCDEASWWVQLYSPEGRMVYRAKGNGGQIEMPMQFHGVYVAKVNSSAGVKVLKLVFP